MRTTLLGLRILVVEDEPMIALIIEDVLLESGCLVLGPHPTFETGLAAARAEQIDLAVLDVNLGEGRRSYPIAEVLAARSIPFLLTSGYGAHSAPPDHPDWPVCSKPFTPAMLRAALLALPAIVERSRSLLEADIEMSAKLDL